MRAAVILAAGCGRRFSSDRFKQFSKLLDEPVLNYSIDKFETTEYVDQYVLTVPPDQLQKTERIIEPQLGDSLYKTIEGGEKRRDSVRKSLNVLSERDPDTVFVHDAARPGFPSTLLKDLADFYAGNNHRSVVPGLPVQDTIKQVKKFDDDTVKETLDRSRLRRIQTPQLFDFSTLKTVHENWETGKPVTDDAMMLEVEGYSTGVIHGSPLAHKITTQSDLSVLECLLKESTKA